MTQWRDADEVKALQRRMIDTVQEVLQGTDWGPEAGGLIVDCVVIVGWIDADGDPGSCHLRCGSPWATEGLVVDAARKIEANSFDDD